MGKQQKQDSESILIEDDDDAKFSDALEEFPFFDASNSFELQHSVSVSDLDENSNINNDSMAKQPNHTPESQSFRSSSGLRRRRGFSRQSSKEIRFKKSESDFDVYGSNVCSEKSKKFLRNLKENQKLNDKLNLARVCMSSESVGKRITDETNENSLNSSLISTVIDDESVSDTTNSGLNLFFFIARIMIKAIAFQATLVVGFVTFPIWLMYSSYMFVVDPFTITRRAKRYVKRRILRFLGFCFGNIKWILHHWIKRNKSTWKLCLQIGWGLLWSAFVGLILVGLLVFSFVVSGIIMKCIIEKPVENIEQLNFDYTRHTPMAFVPLMSCSEDICLECSEKMEFDHVAQSRVVPVNHKLQATVLLTLPESDYNRNLGIFQVRVDFLSNNGKPLGTTTQPSMLQFKSQPIRLLTTIFKLVPLITGYSSESQTLEIKFKKYIEREIPTSCVRVVLQPRAESAKGGGIPEIYAAYVKLESQLPLLKRILWSWKATVFVWISIVTFTVGLVFMLLCCTPVIVPWLKPMVVSLNNFGRT